MVLQPGIESSYQSVYLRTSSQSVSSSYHRYRFSCFHLLLQANSNSLGMDQSSTPSLMKQISFEKVGTKCGNLVLKNGRKVENL